jgi:hypothetical protein
MRLVGVALLVQVAVLVANATEQKLFPLWAGQPIEEYARAVNLPATKAIDLGDGVKLDLVLIPAGKFIMGTHGPEWIDDEMPCVTNIWLGQLALATSCAVFLTLVTFVVIRSARQKRWPQFSLARLLVLTIVAGAGLLGGMHWHHSQQELEARRLRLKNELDAHFRVCNPRFEWTYWQELPAHEVTIAYPFYMGKFEVTKKQFHQITGRSFRGVNLAEPHPVSGVTCDEEIKQFCEKVTTIASSSGIQLVRLPSEAEWEYACRAGTQSTYYTGYTEADLDRAGWHVDNRKKELDEMGKPLFSMPVGKKEPNAWGLYDLYGNMYELCEDDWHYNYLEAPKDGRAWVSVGEQEISCVARGGSLNSDRIDCRSASRTFKDRTGHQSFVGFRVVAEPVGVQRPAPDSTQPPFP